MKRGYHHGNLRQALVEAALDLIAEQGPTGFTMAEAAKVAGVSAAAPYRHFGGRDDLIAEVATQGYDLFADVLEFAYDGGKPSALTAFEKVGRAYLAFARKHTGYYMAMFESGVAPNATPELSRAADRVNRVMAQASNALSARLPEGKRPPGALFQAHIAALSHGIVELYARGKPGARSAFSPEDLLETGVGIYLRGLGLIDPD
jgi:AcrR family transcriptional regulator